MILLSVTMFAIAVFHDGQLAWDSPGQQVHAIELKVDADGKQYELDEEITAVVRVTNHSQRPALIAVPNGSIDGIAWALAVHRTEGWEGLLQPASQSGKDMYEADSFFVYTLEPKDMLEQSFVWHQRVIDPLAMAPEDNELPAPSGEYQLFAVVLVGEEEVTASTKFTILGERDFISFREAVEISMQHDDFKHWYMDRTYDGLVKREQGAWFIKDTDGSWVRSEQEHAEQLKGIAPQVAGGEREEGLVRVHFRSELGGPPQQVTVVIDAVTKQAVSFEW